MNESGRRSDREKGTLRTLLVACGLAVGFLVWGLFIFFTVGDKGPPAWNYGTVPDVPGLSVFSTDSARPIPTVPPRFLHEKAELSPQHVKDKPSILEYTPEPVPESLPQTPESQGKEPSS